MSQTAMPIWLRKLPGNHLGWLARCCKLKMMRVPFHPPVKRSVEIAGHKTSISLEPVFWNMLKARAAAQNVPINALIAGIDAERLEAGTPPGLAGAIRVWLVST